MKNGLIWFWNLDRRIWGDKLDTNRYFATLSVLCAALAGACAGGGQVLSAWFRWDLAVSNVAVIGLSIFIWGLNVAESIIASKGFAIPVWRSLLLLVTLLAATAIGYAGAVVVLFLILIVLVLFVVAGGIGAMGGAASGSSSSSNDEQEEYIHNEYGGKVTLKEGFGGKMHGSDGRTYERTGGGYVRESDD